MGVTDWSFKDEYFGPLLPYVNDDMITDINVSQGVTWVEHLTKGVFKIEESLDEEFHIQFSNRVANLVGEQFNKYNPVLEAETDTLRLSIIHPSVTSTGYSISIRKTPKVVRLSEQMMYREGYCTKLVHDFLKWCVQKKYNMIFCGTPGTGKTELLKYLTRFIPLSEKVYTIEDNYEIHYESINLGSQCVSVKVDEELFDYTKAIKTALRQNPKWVLLSEARSVEVKYLLEGFSTGIHGLTTLHTDDVRKIPDRIVNMMKDDTSGRVINEVFNFIDVGVLLKKDVTPEGRIVRKIDQICLFRREGKENKTYMIYDDGELFDLPNFVDFRG